MYVTSLADPLRVQQIALLCGTIRPFQRCAVINDLDGKAWACARINDNLFAVPVERLKKGLSFGPIAERILWLIHAAVRERRIPQVQFPKKTLCAQIWGASLTRRSSQTLRESLKSLAELRIAEWPPQSIEPPLAQSLPLFAQINAESDHFVFVVGEGFLGSLEQFAVQEHGAVAYKFPSKKELKGLRKDQRIHSVYLPIQLGDFSATKRFTPRQKRLFQAIFNELTCPPKPKESLGNKFIVNSIDTPQIITGGQVVGYSGRNFLECPELNSLVNHIEFNGNGVRRGCGYKMQTWMRKSGYAIAELHDFLSDLSVLCRELGLIVAGIGKGIDAWCPLSRIGLLARIEGYGRSKLDGLHIRIYCKADCFERWNRLFQWDFMAGTASEGSDGHSINDIVGKLRELMLAGGLTQQQIAAELKVSKQYVSAILTAKKCCSGALKKKIEEYLARLTKPSPCRTTKQIAKPRFELVDIQVKPGSATLRKYALNYYDRGFCVIPIFSWESSRKPFVKWTQFQTKRPTRQQVNDWWIQWPDAGIAVILGPVSNLFCVDVDGEEAHRILLDVYGMIPIAPTVKSGSGDPFRYHLYFRHPEQLSTSASKTPFNHVDDKGKLELRGEKGLLVLPPSLHKSGRRYAWVKGRSLDDIDLPELPDVLLETLEATLKPLDDSMEPEVIAATAATNKSGGKTMNFGGYLVAPSTARFLSGQYSESSHWNQRIFRAACDLNARGVPFAKAENMLLKSAAPKTSGDEQAAHDTIESAYSEPREPSHY